MRPVIVRAAIMAAFIAPLLILINQWEAIMGEAQISYVKIAVTALVAFGVSLVGGMLTKPKPRR